MKTNLPIRLLLVCSLGPLFASAPLFAKASPDEKHAEVRKMRDTVLAELYKLHPEARTKLEKAAGYAVFSNVGVNVLFASVAGGSGVVVKHGVTGGAETFMKMGSAGIGLGLGVKDFRAVFIY